MLSLAVFWNPGQVEEGSDRQWQKHQYDKVLQPLFPPRLQNTLQDTLSCYPLQFVGERAERRFASCLSRGLAHSTPGYHAVARPAIC